MLPALVQITELLPLQELQAVMELTNTVSTAEQHGAVWATLPTFHRQLMMSGSGMQPTLHA
jgi:hypothetical protein